MNSSQHKIYAALKPGPMHFGKILHLMSDYTADAVESFLQGMKREGRIINNGRGVWARTGDKARLETMLMKVADLKGPSPTVVGARGDAEPSLLQQVREAKQVVNKASQVFSRVACRPECLIGREDELRESAIDLLAVRQLLIELEEHV